MGPMGGFSEQGTDSEEIYTWVLGRKEEISDSIKEEELDNHIKLLEQGRRETGG